MSLNDHALGANKGVDMYPGVANPTASSTHADPLASNFVTDPTTEEPGAGAGPEFDGHKQARRTFRETAGVVEGRPGIIESTHIDPLAEDSNKDDGWANAMHTPGGGGGEGGEMSGVVGGAAGGASVSGAAKYGYGAVVGDEGTKQAGREAVSGK